MNIEEKVRLLVNKYSLTKTDRETKTLYFGSNRAISIKKVKKSATSPGLVRYKIWKSKPPSCKISILENSESLALQYWNLILRQLRFPDLVLDSIKLQYAQRFLALNHLSLCFFAVKCHKISVKCRRNLQIRA